jgi:hypothetical protein
VCSSDLQTLFGINWREQTNTNPYDDFDGDGISNLNEFLLGTDPTDNNCRLSNKISAIKPRDSKNYFVISIDPVVGTNLGTTKLISTFTLEEGNNWQGPELVIQPNPTAEIRQVDVEVEINSPQQFFRVIFIPKQEIIDNLGY